MKIRGHHYLTGRVCDIDIADGVIRAIAPIAEPAPNTDLWLAPGLIDIQVNGYRGHDICSADVSVDDVVAVAEQLADAGVTAFCPTVITSSPAAIEASLHTIAQACKRSSIVRERVVCIHLEGPYISALDGPRGAHPREHVKDPDWQEFLRWQQAADGRIGMITLAPELPGVLEFINKAVQADVVIALGHHAATADQIHAAVHAGAVISTHLGNGSHSVLPRHHNYIWEQLAHDGLMASIIADGHHLPPAVVKSFYRVKGQSRLILVSDVVAAAGLPVGSYTFMGQPTEVRADGSVRLLGTPYLAGSALKLCDAVVNMMSFSGASFGDAVLMATANPARLLGVHRERGSLTIGARADLAVFRIAVDRMTLVCTIAGGEVCYQA